MILARLTPAFAEAYRELMLEAYARHPAAFTSLVAERADLPLTWWQERLLDAPDADFLVVGAHHEGELFGAAGVSFSTRAKLKHRALIFGMYVRESQRGLGLGGRLLERALEEARGRPGTKVAQLTVTEGNRAAQRLYSAAGFQVYGTEPFAMAVDDGFVSKVYMWLEL